MSGYDNYDNFIAEEEGTVYPRSERKQIEGYYESDCERGVVRCCGAGFCIVMGMLSLSWALHAFPVATVSDVPAFARSLIWMSIAHHTDAWAAYQAGVPPPPPQFGDGSGFFAPVLSPAPSPPPARL